jgi:plastocyanin
MFMMRLPRTLALCLGLSACGAAAPPPPAASAPPAANAAAAAEPPAATANAEPGSAAGASAAPASAPPPTGASPATVPSAEPAAPSTAPAAPPTAPAKGNLSGTVSAMSASATKAAVVYLQNGPVDQAIDATVDNKQMAFVPEVIVVTVGAKVKFKNSDPFPHNVFSPDNEKFDIGQIQQHAVKMHTFDKQGVYTVLCNLHPNMKGYVVVVPSSYFAKVDAKGNFSIKDVPAGTYQVTAWAPHMKPATQTVTVAGDATTSFELHR